MASPTANGSRRPRHHRAGNAKPRAYAAVDLGTNNCRMLIARPARRGFRVIGSYSRIVRLGEALHATGALSEAAMARAIDALALCARKIARHEGCRVRAVATEACRRASNGDAFVARVAGEAGIGLEVISGEEEARLAFAGCTPLIDDHVQGVLVFDIGGGSTEILWAEREADGALDLSAWTSVPCGVVALAEELGGDLVGDDAYGAVVERARAALAAFDEHNGISRRLAGTPSQMLGTSGTMTTIAGAWLGLERYDRARVDGLRLDFSEVVAVSKRLRALDFAGRAALPSIGPERADLVVAGCAIVDAIHRTWPVSGLRVADRGLREGMLAGMIAADSARSASAAA